MRETQCEYRFSVYKCLREGEDGFDFDEVRETLYDGDDFEKLQTVIAAHAMKFEPVTEGLKS